jgi:hypothetical protein
VTTTSRYIKNTQFYYVIKFLSFTLKQQFQIFGIKVLTKIFVLRRDKVRGGVEVLHKRKFMQVLKLLLQRHYQSL